MGSREERPLQMKYSKARNENKLEKKVQWNSIKRAKGVRKRRMRERKRERDKGKDRDREGVGKRGRERKS